MSLAGTREGADSPPQPAQGVFGRVAPLVAEAEPQEIRITAAGREDVARCNADAGLDRLADRVVGEGLVAALDRICQEAEAAIAQGSRFARVSTKLTITMTAWRKAVES